MSKHKKTFIASAISLIIGTSCCWISSLAIWFGGTVLLTTLASQIQSLQVPFLILAALLGIVSLLLYKNRK